MKLLTLAALSAMTFGYTIKSEACVEYNPQTQIYTIDAAGKYRNSKSHSKEKRPGPVRPKYDVAKKK